MLSTLIPFFWVVVDVARIESHRHFARREMVRQLRMLEIAASLS